MKAIRRKNYDDNKLWESLSLEKKNKFNEEFYKLICDSNNFVLAALIDKEKMEDKNKNLLFYLAYGFIIQRYQYVLSKKNENGIVIMDGADTSNKVKSLYYAHKKFSEEGVPVKRDDIILKIGGNEFPLKNYKKLKIANICENLFFLNDNDTNLLQVVDMIAAAFSSNFNRGNPVWFNKVKPIIRSDATGKIEGYGIKIFP